MSTATASRAAFDAPLSAEMFANPEAKSGLSFRVRSGAAYERFRNSLNPGIGPKGGYLIGESVAEAFEIALDDSSAIRKVATVMRRSTGERFSWPVLDDTLQEGIILEPGEDANTLDPAFQSVTFEPRKFGSKRVPVSNTLLMTSPIVLSAVAAVLGQRIGRRQNKYYTVGKTGAGGLLYDCQVGKTTASPTAFTADELLELVSAVPDEYRANGRWMMSGAVWLACKRLKVGDQYAWRAAGLDEWPVVINKHMPTSITASSRPILFGDFSRFLIVDEDSSRLYTDTETFIENDQTGFEIFMRSDGALLDAGTGPVQALKMSA